MVGAIISTRLFSCVYYAAHDRMAHGKPPSSQTSLTRWLSLVSTATAPTIIPRRCTGLSASGCRTRTPGSSTCNRFELGGGSKSPTTAAPSLTAGPCTKSSTVTAPRQHVTKIVRTRWWVASPSRSSVAMQQQCCNVMEYEYIVSCEYVGYVPTRLSTSQCCNKTKLPMSSSLGLMRMARGVESKRSPVQSSACRLGSTAAAPAIIRQVFFDFL
jgi:hypothetical protein